MISHRINVNLGTRICLTLSMLVQVDFETIHLILLQANLVQCGRSYAMGWQTELDVLFILGMGIGTRSFWIVVVWSNYSYTSIFPDIITWNQIAQNNIVVHCTGNIVHGDNDLGTLRGSNVTKAGCGSTINRPFSSNNCAL